MKYTIIFMITGILFFCLMTYSHELAHVAIYDFYGIDSEIKFELKADEGSRYSKFPYSYLYTANERNCPNDTCKLAHHQNEIFFYTILPFCAIIYFALIFIILTLEDKNEKTNTN